MLSSIIPSQPDTRTLFIDAAGTLIQVRDSVGTTYSRLANAHGLRLDAHLLETAFRSAWRSLPQPQHEGVPSSDDEKSWWLELVNRCFEAVLGEPVPCEILHPLFEDLYSFYALPSSWQVYPDVIPALELLRPRLRLNVLSNFDRRLRSILVGHGLDTYFDAIIVSSEVGASKPHPILFATAARIANCPPEHCAHVGDDLVCDFQGARDAGFRAFHLDRKTSTLHDIAQKILGL